MNIDVAFWLTLLLLICVITWVVDRIWKIRQQPAHILKGGTEFIISLMPVFFVVLVIRSFMVEPFSIPSGSMIPTLQVHDFIVVSKPSYGLRLPVTNTKIIATGEPKHGDVMVFRYPENTAVHFIKRVVGLPGDTVAMRDGQLWLNNKKVPAEVISHRVEGGIYHQTELENLDGKKHLIQRQTVLNPYTGEPDWHYRDGEWEVPEGHYFVMGDNRDNSNDSRFWGTVPESLVEGRAFMVWMHLDADFPWVNFSRNGALDKEYASQ